MNKIPKPTKHTQKMDNIDHCITGFYSGHIIPLDRCVISTRFEVNPEVFIDRHGFNEKMGTSIIDADLNSRVSDGNDWKTYKLVFGAYGGIVVFCRKDEDRWFAHKIHLNARNLHYRHNAKAISAEQFMIALTILRDEVYRIMRNPKDIIHAVPGLHPNSRSYWSLFEFAHDIEDPEGVYEKVFRNPHYPNMSEGFRYKNGTIQIGCPKGPMKIKFYNKTKEASKRLRENKIENAACLFRVEIVLSQNKLIEHLGHNRNLQKIDNRDRLVRFTLDDIIDFHRQTVSRLEGCFITDSNLTDGGDKLGRFMAHVSTQQNITLNELFEIYETKIQCSKRTGTRHRKAAREELKRISLLNFEDVFSYQKYQNPPSINIPGLEKSAPYRGLYGCSDNDIWEVYGCPQPFRCQASVA